MQSANILLIEEDKISREVLQLMLAQKFSLKVVEDLHTAEAEILADEYDIIIMDVQTKAYDGLSLCKLISSQSMSSPPLVIAIGETSKEDDIRDIFAAGAYDYFVKPYNVVLFFESLQRIVATLNNYQALEKNDQDSRDVLGVAMSQASYYGFAFDLLSEINHSKSIESLAQTVLNGLSSRGIHCALQITDTQGNISTFEENKDVVGERTLQVFSVVRDQGRVFRFGRRLVFNDDHASLFVKSMSDMGDTAYDCVLDIGAKLIPCIEEQIFSIGEHLLLTELQTETKNIVQELHTALTLQTDKTDKIIQNVAGNINTSFDKLELTEAQEQFFLKLIETELLVEQSGVDFELLEQSAQAIYDKIAILQNESEKQPAHSSQFGDVDLF
ncbi:response regulator [Glaciecola petra]|uniref:Response regulator n=1 Tax=Glaciecola petra TaxID=3075602 RepID=A0ABU2ZSI0_9ALTE|nr:response regulator [Aestuariibacter sp. P117]MDT0595269.1 response regulator [Aestuariibacter sp. P117]